MDPRAPSKDIHQKCRGHHPAQPEHELAAILHEESSLGICQGPVRSICHERGQVDDACLWVWCPERGT